jgi:hypothetical protein
MALALDGQESERTARSSCCIRTVEKWYAQLLCTLGGHHSAVMTDFFRSFNREVAPLFADLLNIGVEFRIAASKSVGLARMQPLVCEECGNRVALVILGLPFMLLLFRLQCIFVSLIERWELIPEGPDRWRERIEVRSVGKEQLRQLNLGLDMYLGEKDVTLEGMEELLATLQNGDALARRIMLHALQVAESWVVAHEVFHVCILAQHGGPFPQFATIAEANSDVLEYASQFSSLATKQLGLRSSTAASWLEEFQADILACKMLYVAILDKRYGSEGKITFPGKDARFDAARAVLNGVAAALEVIYWVDVQGKHISSSDQIKNSSHPPQDLRWRLITMFLEDMFGSEDEGLSLPTEMMGELSKRLMDAYESKSA